MRQGRQPGPQDLPAARPAGVAASTPSPGLAVSRFDLSRHTLWWLVDNHGNVPAACDPWISPWRATQSLATIDPACGLADQLFWSASQPSRSVFEW